MIKVYFLILVFLISSCGSPSQIKPSAKQGFKKKIRAARTALQAFNEKTFWSDYDAILKASAKASYLKNSDQVFYLSYINYKKLSSKKSFLTIIDSQLSKLAKTKIPDETPSQIAFWINTYNFLVISEIVHNYPLKSNKAIRFKSKKHLISGKHYSLQEIYENLLSKQDPRILLALNSGQVAGPSLKLKSFSSANLSTELNRETENNLLNPVIISLETNILNEDQLNISEIFKDFDDNKFPSIKLVDFLKTNLPEHLKHFKKYKISKSTYDGINSKRETMKLLKAISPEDLESM